MNKMLNSQKGIAHVFLILFLLIAVGVGVFLVSKQTNLTPKASGGSVAFVDESGNPICASDNCVTYNTKVNVSLSAPYPPIPGDTPTTSPSASPISDNSQEPSSSPYTDGDPIEGPYVCNSEKGKKIKCPPGNSNYQEVEKQNKEKPKKKKTNEVLIEGRVSASIDLNASKPEADQSPHIYLYLVNLCDPNGDGLEDYASVDSSGYFSYLINKGSKFCVRPPEIKGYDFPPVTVGVKNANSYEEQIAGFDCASKDFKKKQCQSLVNKRLDLSADNNFDFSYQKSSSSSNIYTTSVSFSEDPYFSSPYLSVDYIKENMIVPYDFKTAGKKTLYIRFNQTSGNPIDAKPFPLKIEILAPSPTVKPQPVKVTSPNEGNFKVGEIMRITWEYDPNISTAKPYFSPRFLPEGTDFSYPLTGNLGSQARSYDWVVSDKFGLKGKIRVMVGDQEYDDSDGIIEIVRPLPSPSPSPQARFIKLTYPNGGETLKAGDNVRVTWQSGDVDNCSLGYTFGPGSLNWIKFDGVNPALGYYDWVVNIGNQLPGSSRQVKLDMGCFKTGEGGLLIDQSDDFFTVTKP